jgi:pimeloyl-ACP methyl ester carboxylesterase
MTEREPHRELVVLLHAWRQSPASLAQVINEVRRLKPDTEILAPALPLGFFSLADLAQVIDTLLDRIDSHPAVRASGGSPSISITLIGYSFGAVLARALFVAAMGDLGYEREQPWARSVERIILLAGTNRGWTPSSAVSPLQRFVYAVTSGAGHVLSCATGRDSVIMQVRRGAPFLTCVRLEWLRLQELWVRREQPIVVQLLGTVDDLVSPSDNLDLATGRGFFYLEVPGSGHVDVIEMDPDRAPEKARAIVEARRDRFEQALTATREVLADIAIRPADVDDLLQLATDDFDVDPVAKQFPAVSDVVFVIHGIRD